MTENREEELFLQSDDVERTAFLGEYSHSKRKTFISRYLVWVINAALVVVVLGVLWERNDRTRIYHQRDQGIYCASES